MDEEEIQSFLIISSIVLFSVVLTMILLFTFFQKRKNMLLLEKKDAEKRFEEEISKTKIEIREETFKNISWELHDNIGQLLTLAKIQLQSNSSYEEIKKTLDKSLKELRALAKQVNPDALAKISLEEAINQEAERLNRLNFIKANVEINGIRRNINPKAEIIFFRILQEFLSNTIKHARATYLSIELNFNETELIIKAQDNGRGFNNNNNHLGMGISNMENRARLVNAKVVLSSVKGKGVKLKITYKY